MYIPSAEKKKKREPHPIFQDEARFFYGLRGEAPVSQGKEHGRWKSLSHAGEPPYCDRKKKKRASHSR